MQTSKYWDDRALRRLSESEKQAEIVNNRIKKIYDKANKNIQRELDSVYRNYSKTTGLDVQKLKELLTKKETDKVWKTLKRQGLDQYVMNNYKSRISRLEQIQAQIYAKAKQIYTKEEVEQRMCYKGVINDTYYKTVYDTQMGTGYAFGFSKLDNHTINELLSERWSGKNYSERIWTNTDALANQLSTIIGGALLSGQSIEKTSRQVRERFKVAKYYSNRLVRTEVNYFNNEIDAKAYEEMGIDKYVFVATLDNRTSAICQSMDNKVFDYKKRQTGVNFPPMHPNCRSKTRGYLGKEIENKMKRKAINPITGKAEKINNISYDKWLKQYNIVGTQDGMFKTSQNVIYNTQTLGKLDKKLIEVNANRLSELIKKYPKISKYISDRGLNFGGSTSTNAIAYTRWTKDLKNIGIYLENKYYKNADYHIKTISDGIKKGQFMPCSDNNINKYAVTHEFGHVIETYLLNEYNINNPLEYENALSNQYQWNKYKEKVYGNIRNDIINIAVKNNSDFDINSKLSKYGKSSPAEFFAECFANAECGKPNELGKAMKEYLKGVI